MSPNIQENIRAKAERETVTFSDEDLVTVLHGFGKVPPNSTSYLDTYEVKGGVIKNVPYSVAKHWQNGTRPDGTRPHGRVKVTILPKDASEDDLASAAGLSPAERRKMAALVTAGDASHLLADLGPERARELRDALSAYLNNT